ncbi:unnamed protein product [Phaedon cochleariae]|uniref:RING-type domain-containing protein n=1 Tax=Phaedon cochleariae TaxID=80249 RepID=A0A9P0GSJ1_PHACE|nr:unnamed protein product [Phaedon cochleariae]
MADSLEQLIQREMATLKCSLCFNIVSVPPVDLLSKDGKQLRCGRCKFVPKESLGRDYAFEKIAKLLSFPCIYEGCDEVLSWGEVKKHEEVCNERTVMCPIDQQGCKSAYKMKNLEKHCLNKHRSNIFYESFTIKCDTSKNLPCVLVFEKQIFFIFIVGGNPSFDIFVTSSNKNTSFKFNLKLASISSDACVMFEQQYIMKYDERTYCFNCILKECTLIHHHKSKNYQSLGIPRIDSWGKRIYLDLIQPLFKDTKEINLKLEIVANDQSLNNDIEPNDHISDQTNQLRDSLQCPICKEYMIGDIFNCEHGHVVCITCKSKLDFCPSCRTKFGISRNLPLENLAEVLMLSCSFAEKGCNFSGQVKMLFQHEKECEHKED